MTVAYFSDNACMYSPPTPQHTQVLESPPRWEREEAESVSSGDEQERLVDVRTLCVCVSLSVCVSVCWCMRVCLCVCTYPSFSFPIDSSSLSNLPRSLPALLFLFPPF